jgi:hypothetical protein
MFYWLLIATNLRQEKITENIYVQLICRPHVEFQKDKSISLKRKHQLLLLQGDPNLLDVSSILPGLPSYLLLSEFSSSLTSSKMLNISVRN